MLDQDQQKIANLKEGYFFIGASAGGGKTTVLLHRANNLQKLGSHLTVTFTSEASKNLKTRSASLFPTIPSDSFSTLHALALKFAQTHPDAYPFQISDNPLAGEGVAAKAVFDATKNKINFKAFMSWVSLQKRNRISPAEAVVEAVKTGKALDYAQSYKLYQHGLQKQGVLDYDDLIFQFVEILERRPDLRSAWSPKFLQVDESQDCCKLDYRLLQLLSMKNKSLLMVGDLNQALYSFRGGDSELFNNMEEFFPGTQKFYLGRNYRSYKNIVEFSKKIAHYQDLAQHFYAVSEEEGPLPIITGYSTDFSEAEGVVKKIKELGPDNCAVLARTNLALRSTEEFLIEENIKYHILGDSGFWSQQEVLNVLAYVRCMFSPTDNSLLSALRTPYHPTKFIKRKVIADEIKMESEKTGKKVWDIMKIHPKLGDFVNFIKSSFSYKNLPSMQAVSNIIRDLKCYEYYREEEGVSPDSNPLDSMKELIRISSKYDSLADFLTFVRKIQGVSRTRKGVCLSTIHSAKGKEWDNVFLISVNMGILPHAKSDNPPEERNCYYVGCTRAAKRLEVSWHGTPSPYLARS